MSEDYYAVLGVARDASEKDIKRAFRAIAKTCHPDIVGNNQALLEKFKRAKEAYDVLGDVDKRAKYDRRKDRRADRIRGGSSFREAFYRRTSAGPSAKKKPGAAAKRPFESENNIGLDDIFSDFGFGQSSASKQRRRPSTPQGSRPRAHAPTSQPGRDVHIDLDVSESVARTGGTVSAVFYRMQRADGWVPGSTDPGVVRVQDVADVRVSAATRHGEVIYVRGFGDAGIYGGPFGDLVVRVNIVKGEEHDQASSEADEQQERVSMVVNVPVWDALLGGRVEVMTPQGRVRITIPAGTNSGKKLRLREKGLAGPGGKPRDLVIRLRVVVPKEIDPASEELLWQVAERFGKERS